MRPTSTIGTAYFSITDCTVNLSLSRAVTGRDKAISRHHLKNGKHLEISVVDLIRTLLSLYAMRGDAKKRSQVLQ